MSVFEDVKPPENEPVFFTGLGEGADQAPRKTLLCLICGSSLSSDSQSKECEKCDKTFENIKKAIVFLSNSSSPVLTPSPSHNGVPSVSGSRRKTLLPTPEISEAKRPCNQRNSSTRNEEQSEAPSGTKRKHTPETPVSKRSKHEHFVPVTQPLPGNYALLSQSIWKLFEDNQQTKEVYAKKMTLRKKLHEILLTRFPACGLYVVGSSMTGLGCNSSDMDMCLMLTDDEIDQENVAKDILHTIEDLFSNYCFLQGVEVIYARVPIIRFLDSVSNIEVDLNINNSVGIRNTQLLSSYARMDKRLPPLVLLVKMWARYHGINDAKNNTLSSYSLVLMVIHFLQYGCEPPILPCLQKLQPDKYLPRSDVRKLKLKEELPIYRSSNHQNVGELFIGFLNYFCYKFDYFRDVMSVRLGTVIPKEEAMNNTFSPKNKRGHWKWICIEEPFELTNTACAVFKPDVFKYMRRVFYDCFMQIRRNSNLDGIIR